MENERDLLEYEKKDVEKKLTDQKADSELLRGQLRVCCSVLHVIAVFFSMCHNFYASKSIVICYVYRILLLPHIICTIFCFLMRTFFTSTNITTL